MAKREAYDNSEPQWIPSFDEDMMSNFILRHSNWCNFNWDKQDYKENTLKYIIKDKPLHKIVSGVSFMNNGFRTIGSFCRMAEMGFPLSDKIKQKIKEEVSELKKQKQEVVQENVKISIQEKIKERICDILEMIEVRVDEFIECLVKDKNCAFNASALFAHIGVKPVHTARIISSFEPRVKEIESALGGDEELMEGYSFLGKVKLKKYLEFNKGIVETCRSIVTDKPKRKKKKVKPEVLVKGLKYLIEDTTLGIRSIDPKTILNKKSLITYNTKNKKSTLLVSDYGLSVKGSSIIGFNPSLSTTKRIKDKKTLFPLTKGNTGVQSYFKSIKSKESVAKGRINKDTLLIGVQ